MISPDVFLLFIGASILLMLSPGPDMLYILTRSVAQSRKAGLIATLGANAGAYVHLLAAIVGLSAVLATSAFAFTFIKIIGACYLIWLGLNILFSKVSSIHINEGQSKNYKLKTVFLQGVLTNVLNPKVVIFYMAFMPQFINLNGSDQTSQLLILGLTLNMLALIFNSMIVYFASAATQKLSHDRRFVLWLNRLMGTVFIALGVRLAREKI